MLKKLMSVGLATILLHATSALPLRVFGQTSGEQAQLEKVKSQVNKYANKNTRVTVKLKDGSKLKGNIVQANQDSFTLTDSKSSTTKTINYADVAEVNKQGGLSLLAKIGIGLGVAVGVLAILYGVACHDDPIC